MNKKATDEKWIACCKVVDNRDKSCRVMRCLTPGETALIGNKGKMRLDRAHIFAKSIYPELIYNPKNIVKINRFSHRNLDDCKSPITGESISQNERNWWWYRILMRTTEKYDEEKDYKKIILKIVTKLIV
jgi:hypothetical protein